MDQRLRQIADEWDRTGWAVELVDADWTLVWVSDETKALLDERDAGKLGLGEHLFATRTLDAWGASITDESRRRWTELNLPYMAHDHRDGSEGLRRLADDRFGLLEGIDSIEPVAAPPLWISTLGFLQGDLPPATVTYVGIRHEFGGEMFGTSFLYGPSLPATLQALVLRGDEEMFARMARLFEPAQRSAAVLFADLRSSSSLSRRLPSAAYFEVVRAVMTAVDRQIIKRRGIVGKHAGDGGTAFFLSEDLQTDSAASRAAIEAARELPRAAAAAIADLPDQVPIDPEEIVLGIGVHWGAALYIGQVITGGRLEVTALGDAVNEGARIEQSAQRGEILASKDLIERLSNADSTALQLDRDNIRYEPLAEREGSTDKARRDAVNLAVTDLRVLNGPVR